MFSILLGICLSATTPDPTKLCLKSTGTCPDGYQSFTAEADLLAAITAPSTSIVTEIDIAAIPIAKLQNVVEIKLLGSTQAKVSCAITASAEHTGLTLSNINLEVTTTAPPSKKLRTDPAVLNFAKLTLEEGAKLEDATTVSVVELKCTTAASAATAIASCKGTGAKFILEGKDVINQVTAASAGATLTDGASPITIAATGYTTTVISTITKPGTTFTLSGIFTALTATISIELVNSKIPGVYVTLKDSTDFAGKDTLTVKVNTYYKEDPALTANGKTTYTREPAMKVNDSGTRTSVPAAPVYCLLKTGTYATDCPPGSEGLWSEAELINATNGDKVANVHLVGYDSDSMILALTFEDYKAKSLRFIGKVKQYISLELKTASDTFTGTLQFDTIDLTAIVATDGESKLNFKSLFVKKSKITPKAKTTPPAPAPDPDTPAQGSKKLRTDPPTIKVSSVDLTTDAASFGDFKADKPSNSFTIVDVVSAKFDGEGKNVTIDTVIFKDTTIPIPFTISATDSTAAATLTITKNGDAAGKALPFKINLPAGTKLTTTFDGDWSENEIIVNVEANSTYKGTVATGDGNKGPTMWKTGSGVAKLGEDDIKTLIVDSPTPTPKGGLSGGAIAGIVIACVAVVAAVVVVVVVVIKKKKGKVAN